MHLTEKPGDASGLAVFLTKDYKEPRIIVAMGGNGTVNEVLSGLVFCGPIAPDYIPTGFGNDLIKELKLPRRPGRCLKKILNPRYYELLDYGMVSYDLEEVAHRRFAVSAGIGYDAAVCHNLLYSRLKRVLNRIHLDKLNYILISIKQLVLAHPVEGYLLLDGAQEMEFNHIYFVSAYIHPYKDGRFKFVPKAKPADDMLDICVIHDTVKRRLTPVLINTYLGGRTNHRGVRHYICQEAKVHTDKTTPMHMDGENCYCQNDLQIRCIEKKLRLIV